MNGDRTSQRVLLSLPTLMDYFCLFEATIGALLKKTYRVVPSDAGDVGDEAMNDGATN